MHLLLCVVLFPFCRATLNPVARNFSDPSIYHDAVNKLVSFASSHGESNVPIARSTNGINWCSTSDYTCGNTSDAFPDVPAWVQPGSIYAPSIAKVETRTSCLAEPTDTNDGNKD